MEEQVRRSRESTPVTARQIRFLNILKFKAKSNMDVDSIKTVGEWLRAKIFLEGVIRGMKK